MEQLSGLDASFLNLETSTVHGHVGSLAIFDARSTELSLDTLKRLVQERLDELAPFRRRLMTVPFGIDRPYWIEDSEFDLDYHVRHIAVPAPGDDRELAGLVERLHGRPLDRDRPLWELYLIEGLDRGRVAQYTKIHHACVDGVSGTEVLTTLLDTDPDGRPAEAQPLPWTADRVPTSGEMLTRGLVALATQPRLQVRLQRRMLSAGFRMGRRQVGPGLATVQEALHRTPGVGRLVPPPGPNNDFLSTPALVAPRLSFNRSVSAHRRYAFGSISLEDVKEIRTGRDATVNDVVMAICAGALRSWLTERHELPTDPVLAMVPVSVRDDDERTTTGNRLSAMVAALPTNEDDPLRRLQLARESMRIAKTDHAALPADTLQDFAHFAPPAVAARAARLIARTRLADYTNPAFNLVISNIPGPQHPLYCAGARQIAGFPVAAITDGAGLNITLSSYDGSIDIGILACRDAVDDLWSLIDAIRTATTELLERVRAAEPEPKENR